MVQIIMTVMNSLKKTICKLDLLNSYSLLRHKGQPQHSTILGGIISILFIVLLIVAFRNRIVDTINRNVIITSVESIQLDNPATFNITNDNNFMFGVEIWHQNLNQGKRYFDITLTNTVYQYGDTQKDKSIRYALEPCRKDHWEGFKNIQNDYEKLKVNYWMCLPKNTSFQIKGKYSSEFSKTLDVAVKKCTNSSFDSRPCATEEQIKKMFKDNRGPMFFTIYFLNPLINPGNHQPLSYYLQDSNYISFSDVGGQESIILMEDYQIRTDQSILPIEDQQTKKGGMVTKTPLKSTYSQIDQTYAIFYFFKSPTVTIHHRSFEKIDEVLAYMGGLFSIILAALFLIVSYNHFKFQINFAGSLYQDEQGKKQILKTYNFFDYLLHGFYSILRCFKKYPDSNPGYYYKTRQVTLKELDVLFLFRRINFLEKALRVLLTDRQLQGLHLADDFTMSRVKQLRKDFRIKSRIRKQIREKKKEMQRVANVQNRSQRRLQNSHQNIEQPNVYSDEEQSSSQEENEQNIQNPQQFKLLNSLIQLKKQRDDKSQNIWKQIDKKVAHFIDLMHQCESGNVNMQGMRLQRQQQLIVRQPQIKQNSPYVHIPSIDNPINQNMMFIGQRKLDQNQMMHHRFNSNRQGLHRLQLSSDDEGSPKKE